MNKDDYDTIVPEEYRQYIGKYHYGWALRHVTSFCQQWRLRANVNAPALEWIFDWMEERVPSRKEVETIMEQAESLAIKNRNVHGDYANVHFCRRATIAAIQCVDLIAWTNYRMALKEFVGTPLHPLALETWDDFKKMPPRTSPPIPDVLDWNHSVVLKNESLRTWVEKQLQTGESLAAFKAWHASRKSAAAT